MFEVQSLFVALSALVLTVVILRAKDGVRVNIRIFVLSSISQIITYTLFQFLDIPIETRQFISRMGIITINIALAIIIYAGEKRGY